MTGIIVCNIVAAIVLGVLGAGAIIYIIVKHKKGFHPKSKSHLMMLSSGRHLDTEKGPTTFGGKQTKTVSTDIDSNRNIKGRKSPLY